MLPILVESFCWAGFLGVVEFSFSLAIYAWKIWGKFVFCGIVWPNPSYPRLHKEKPMPSFANLYNSIRSPCAAICGIKSSNLWIFSSIWPQKLTWKIWLLFQFRRLSFDWRPPTFWKVNRTTSSWPFHNDSPLLSSVSACAKTTNSGHFWPFSNF